ncbi:MAG TPA: carbohydrate ABC transporter permease, partial [Geminicoccaceae bacterium]|nr:carbohydrate ABC transporter permease [Geminicoccaceae bacterium]
DLSGRLGRLALIGLALLWSGFPILLVVISSFKQPRQIFELPPSFVFTPTLQNYVRLWNVWPDFFSNMLNSLVITVGATILTIVISSMAGYVYARHANRRLTGSAFFMIFVRMLPPIVITLPLFPVANRLGMHDTHLLLILLYATFYVSLSTWIMRAFIAELPRELEEAAFVDGATLAQTLIRIVLPLAAPGIIASAIFVLVFAWNEYIFALIFTTRAAKTTPLVIAEMLGTVEGVEWGVLFAAATVQLLPLLVMVVALQRFVIAGLTAGAVKS